MNELTHRIGMAIEEVSRLLSFARTEEETAEDGKRRFAKVIKRIERAVDDLIDAKDESF